MAWQYYNLHAHNSELVDGEFRIVNVFPNQDLPSKNLPNLRFSIGLHPWHLERSKIDSELATLKELLTAPRVIALGETGLDRATDIPWELQEKAFRNQLELAGEFSLPVIIHCVRAYPEIIQIKKDFGLIPSWIIHGFRGHPQLAAQLTHQGFVLSFGEAILDPNSKTATALASLEPDCFLLETDEAKLTIEEIYQAAARIRNCDHLTLQSQIETNFAKTIKGDHG